MNKFSRLSFIGTVIVAFVGLQVLAEKFGLTIFYWVGIALFVSFAQRRRTGRQGPEGNQKGPPSGSGCKNVSVGDEGQKQEISV